MDGILRVYVKSDFKKNDFHNFRMAGGNGRSHRLIEKYPDFELWERSEWGHYPNGEVSHNRHEFFIAVPEIPNPVHGVKVEIRDNKIVRFIYPEAKTESNIKQRIRNYQS